MKSKFRNLMRWLGLAAITALVAPPVLAQSAADRAVEAAKQYSGQTLNITWEAGLQALDPLNFSGPKWEELTGVKINVVEVPISELFTKTMAEHRAGTGAYDMLNVVPAWMPDLVAAGVLEPLDSLVDKYGYRDELQDIAPTYRDNQMTVGGKIYGLPDDGDVLINTSVFPTLVWSRAVTKNRLLSIQPTAMAIPGSPILRTTRGVSRPYTNAITTISPSNANRPRQNRMVAWSASTRRMIKLSGLIATTAQKVSRTPFR